MGSRAGIAGAPGRSDPATETPHLTDAELAALVRAVDKRRQRGGDHRSPQGGDHQDGEHRSKRQHCLFERESREKTAELTGISPRQVRKVRVIFDHAEMTGDTEERDAVLEGSMSIGLAAGKRARGFH